MTTRPDMCIALRIIAQCERARREQMALQHAILYGVVIYRLDENFQMEFLDPRDVFLEE